MLKVYMDGQETTQTSLVYADLGKVREEILSVLKVKGHSVKAWELARHLEERLGHPRLYPSVMAVVHASPETFKVERRGVRNTLFVEKIA